MRVFRIVWRLSGLIFPEKREDSGISGVFSLFLESRVRTGHAREELRREHLQRNECGFGRVRRLDGGRHRTVVEHGVLAARHARVDRRADPAAGVPSRLARTQLAADPVVYLVPVGFDCLRAPGLADGTYWRYSVVDQVIAAPYAIGSYELDNDLWMPSANDADWEGGDATVKISKHPSFRAYFDPAGGAPTDDRLDATRLVGRSVWNTRWLLVIPAGSMNADREKALSVFINGSDTNRDGKLDLKPVSDIRIGFRTYSQSGN